MLSFRAICFSLSPNSCSGCGCGAAPGDDTGGDMDHMDELRRRDQLLSWCEQGLLTPSQLKRALAPATSAASAAQWRWALARLLGFYGCLMLALGVIFFFAFNWDELHRGHKLAAAALALSGFAVAAFILDRKSVV